MKKIICYLTIIVLLSLSFTASSNNCVNDDVLDIKKDILVDLGLWKDFNLNNTYITRAEVSAYICMMQDIFEDLYQNPSYERKPLQDVNINHWAYDYILIANHIFSPLGTRVLEGDEQGLLNPDNYCTYSEFIKMLLVTIGWDSKSVLRGYPDGYFYIAKELGLNLLDENKKDLFITKKDAISLIYDLIKLPMLVKNGYGLISLMLGEPILELRKNILQTRGQAKKMDDNNILIDGKIYQGKVKSDDFKEGLVICYYKYDENTCVSSIITCYSINSLTFDNPIEISEEVLD